jgi:hypothetical protein
MPSAISEPPLGLMMFSYSSTSIARRSRPFSGRDSKAFWTRAADVSVNASIGAKAFKLPIIPERAH